MTQPPASQSGEVQRRYPAAPLVGVAAAVFNPAGQVLLVQRGRPPRAGQWGLPGGLLELGERLADGARREVWEECAIDVEIGDVIATFEPIQRDADGRVEYHYVVIDFWARYVAGTAVARDDAAALAWAAMEELAAYGLAQDTVDVVTKAFAAWRRETGD